MESLNKLGAVCQQHYEKILLSLALLGLAFAVVFLKGASSREQEKIREYLTEIERRRTAAVKPVDLTRLEDTLAMVKNPPALTLSSPHNLFNPVKWQRGLNDQYIKHVSGSEGVEQLQITEIRPLNLVIAFGRYTGASYTFYITNEVHTFGSRPATVTRSTKLNATNVHEFILRELKGEPENPEELALELRDSGDKITVSPAQPFRRVEAYEADLKFELEKKTFNKMRAGKTLRLGGEDYTIATIGQNEIVLSGPNEKKYTIRRTTTP